MLKCVMCGFKAASTAEFLDHVTNEHEKPVMNDKSGQVSPSDRQKKNHVGNCHTEPTLESADNEVSQSEKRPKSDPECDQDTDKRVVQCSCKTCGFVSTYKSEVSLARRLVKLAGIFLQRIIRCLYLKDARGGSKNEKEIWRFCWKMFLAQKTMTSSHLLSEQGVAIFFQYALHHFVYIFRNGRN